MASGRSRNWRTWVRREERSGQRGRSGTLARRLQLVLMAAVLVYVVVRVIGPSGPVQEVGNFDSWPFWLETAVQTTAPGTVPAAHTEQKVVVLGLVNRPSAGGAWVTVDGRRVAAFEEWKVNITVREGDTLGLALEEESPPVRVRVIAAAGIRSPRLGSEWSVVTGEEIIGSVLISDR